MADRPDEAPDSERVYALLRSDILSCRLPPGAQIYEQELGRRFGVSKSPVREALLRLREQNLVEVKRRIGYRVRPISLKEVEEMYEIRTIYETACASLAIEHYDEAMLETLVKTADVDGKMPAIEWMAANNMFHETLANSCGNQRFAATTTRFVSEFERINHLSLIRMAEPHDFTRLVADHKAIVAAVIARDKRAATRHVGRHIQNSRRRTLEAINSPLFVA